METLYAVNTPPTSTGSWLMWCKLFTPNIHSPRPLSSIFMSPSLNIHSPSPQYSLPLPSIFPPPSPHYPYQVTPSRLLLNHALSSVLTLDPSFITLTKVFDHISHTHRDALRQCVVDKVKEMMSEEGSRGGCGEMRFRKLVFMIQIGIHCRSLLEVAAEETLKIGGLLLECTCGLHYLEFIPCV